MRQEPPGTVIEALAGDVDVVAVEHPVDEPGGRPLGPHPGDPGDDILQEGDTPVLQAVAPELGPVGLDRVVQEPGDVVRLAEGQEALEAADPDMPVGEPHQDRGAGRGGLVAAHEILAGLDQAEALRGLDALGLQQRGRQHLPHAALEGEPSVGAPGPRRRAAALGAEVEQPPVPEVVHLREQEAAAVAEFGVVRSELVAVVAQRQRRLEAAGQGLEPAEMGDPVRIRQAAEADPPGPVPVAVAQDRRGEPGRGDGIVEGRAEIGVAPRGPEGGVVHAARLPGRRLGCRCGPAPNKPMCRNPVRTSPSAAGPRRRSSRPRPRR